MKDYWWGVAMGIALACSSLPLMLTGEDSFFKGAVLPAWTGWVTFPFGCLILILSIKGLLRGKPKPKTVTEEELAQAKAMLEAMYRREHGEAPKYPEEESEK